MTDRPDPFYDHLTPRAEFADLSDPAWFQPVPDDWVVGVADIVNSTALVQEGRYKTVNMVGAAVISAMVNTLGERRFPYVFGGDGAGFAVSASDAAGARRNMASLRRWAEEEFGISLRAALVPVAGIRAAGRDVRVARHAASPGVDYAMFAGGGLDWAERQMKAGAYAVDPAPPGTQPDLTGLSCRWSNTQARNGQILSIVALPTEKATAPEFAELAYQLIELANKLDRAGHPLPVDGPGIRWPPPGLDLDARVSRRGRNLLVHKVLLSAQNLALAFLFLTKIRLGSFHPDHYARMVSSNADFRKFDDGLKMTLDCDDETQEQIQALLEGARRAGKVRYGLFSQKESMMTCFVPSATRDDHVHFVDGASGGYTMAAAEMNRAATL